MRLTHCARVGVACAAVLGTAYTASPGSAQVIIGRGGGGVSISVPGLGGVRLGGVGIPVRPYNLSRRVLVAPYGVAPSYAYPYGYVGPDYAGSYGPIPRYAARRVTLNGYNDAEGLPTAGELRALEDGDLLNAVVGLAARLEADLDRFDTGEGWQGYLRLPDDALPPPDDERVRLGMTSIVETLKRFERTVANPEYVQISGLPSFAALHSALEETVRRFGAEGARPAPVARALTTSTPAVPTPDSSLAQPDVPVAATEIAETQKLQANRAPATAEPAAGEELPVPPPSLVAPQNSADDERSIIAE